jgi:hypothetical protein
VRRIRTSRIAMEADATSIEWRGRRLRNRGRKARQPIMYARWGRAASIPMVVGELPYTSRA